MPRIRTTKALAQRIELGYFKRPHPLRTARAVLVVGCCVAALAWWGLAGTRARGQRLYSPGRVASVHAMWGADCAACHATAGGFSRAVSDAACLKCHDGSIHDEHQVSLVSTGSDGQRRSGQCVSCHIEHRGQPALSATSDEHCTRCHADLARHDARVPVIAASVQAFGLGDGHPHFGRSLTPPGKTAGPSDWVDPTVLEFNHKTHMGKVPPLAGQAENCTVCHQPLARRATTQPAPREAVADGRYMQPVNYMANCSASGCHPIHTVTLVADLQPGLADGVLLPHADLGQVRSAIERYLRPALSSDTFTGKTTRPAAGAPRSRLPGRKPAEETVVAPISKAEWLRQNARDLLGKINNDRAPAFPAFGGTIPDAEAIPATGDPPAMTGARFVDLYTAYVALNQCNKCHRIEGPFPALAGADDPNAASLRTTPTGILPEPRRWFVNSQFDHRAHRNMSCVGCHAGASNSERTADVLSPDITWTGRDGKPASCMDCHHVPTSANPGAGGNCVTCHVFHDRTKERPPPMGTVAQR